MLSLNNVNGNHFFVSKFGYKKNAPYICIVNQNKSNNNLKTWGQHDNHRTEKMAKYNVTYKCGHTATVQLFGNLDDRYSRLDWLATQECPECRRRREFEQAQAQTSGLPELTGSEKQINWATTIRAKFFAVLDDYTPQFMAIAVPGKEDAVKAMLDQYRDLLTSKTDCRYWIDNRDDMSYIGSVKDFAKYVSETLRNK